MYFKTCVLSGLVYHVPSSVFVQTGSSVATFYKWNTACSFISSAIVNGLFNFPISKGDVVFAVGCCAHTLCHLSRLVGNKGQVRAIVYQDIPPGILDCNVWLHCVSSEVYDPEFEIQQNASLRQIVESLFSSSRIVDNILSFTGMFPTDRSVQCSVFAHNEDLHRKFTSEYYLKKIVTPIIIHLIGKGAKDRKMYIMLDLSQNATCPMHEVLAHIIDPNITLMPREELRLAPNDRMFYMMKCTRSVPSSNTNKKISLHEQLIIHPEETSLPPPGYRTASVSVNPPIQEVPVDLSQWEIREAAANVISAFKHGNITGPMAAHLCALAETLVNEH